MRCTLLTCLVLTPLLANSSLAQVIIKEKMEIRPKGEFSVSSSSSSENLPYFEGSIVPNSRIQRISVRRPCTIVGTGTLTSDGPFNVFLSIGIILGTYPNEADLKNATGSIRGFCGATVPLELWTWTSAAIVITNIEGNISGNQATYNFTGYQSFPHPINVPFTARVTLQAIPNDSDPSTIVMYASPTSLEANGSSELTSNIGATLYDKAGGQVQYCGTASMVFTIENPIEGVTLRGTGKDGLPREGTSIEVKFSGSSSGVTFVWDGGALSEDSVVVRVRADGFGLSATQEITLKGFEELDHFEVRLEPDTVEHSKSAVLTMIAQDANNNEVTIEGSTPFTFTVDKPEYGSIEPASGVTYGVARAAGVRYLANGTNPLTPQRIGITVTGASKSGSGSVVVKKKAELDHFAVTVSPDTVEHGATATITVQAKDRNNNDIELASGTRVNVVLRADEKYGNLTYAGRTGKAIDNIPYEDAKQGKVKFVADGENPIGLEPQKVDVGVTGEGKAGVGSVWTHGALKYTHFKQADSLWGNQKYDEYVDTIIVQPSGKRDTVYYKIRRKGCAVAGMAMVLKAFGVDADPGSLNKWMIENGGYDGPAVIWGSINRYPGNNKVKYNTTVGKGFRWDEKNQLENMDASLVKGLPVLAEVLNPTTNSQHWVLVTGKRGGQYKIFDPGGYANRTTLEEGYKNTVYRFIVYTPKP